MHPKPSTGVSSIMTAVWTDDCVMRKFLKFVSLYDISDICDRCLAEIRNTPVCLCFNISASVRFNAARLFINMDDKVKVSLHTNHLQVYN